MSTEGVVEFIDRVLNDESFQAQLKAEPEKALSQFDLTNEEIAAIKSGGDERLKSLGLDARLSKMSFFGGGFGGEIGGGIDGDATGDLSGDLGADFDGDGDAGTDGGGEGSDTGDADGDSNSFSFQDL